MGNLPKMPSKLKRGLECVFLFFILPPSLYFVRHLLALRVFFILLAAAAVCAFVLRRDPAFDCLALKRFSAFRQDLKSILRIFVPAAVLLFVASAMLIPDKLFAFPKTLPLTWLVVMILYQLLLAWPQELVFRSFFFQRYRPLFGKPSQLIFFSALSFSLAHLFYGNWVAPVLSFAGGLLFAWRYNKSRSLPSMSLEHALWGDYLFTIGIGWYFYIGAIG